MPIETRLRLFANDITSKLIVSSQTSNRQNFKYSSIKSNWYDGTFNSDDRREFMTWGSHLDT